MKKLIKYKGRKAVSPVVATLILIIVAIVGAVAVGLIVSGIGSQTSKQANGGQAAGASSTVIIAGGSTTLYPAVVAGATAFDALHPGVTVNVTTGGSGAGMEGVALGVLDIGDSSSFGQVASAISTYPSANLQAQEVGGSGVVVIENSGSGALISDGAESCAGITAQSLAKIFSTTGGYFYITAGACKATSLLTDGNVNAYSSLAACTAAAGGQTCYTAVSRNDLPSGTEDTFYDYIENSTSGSVTPGWGGATATGNPGVLAYVAGHTDTIGFVDLGFAEQSFGGNIVTTVSVAQVTGTFNLASALTGCTAASITALTGTFTTTPAAATGASNCFVTAGQSSSNLHNYIKTGLNTAPSAISATNQVYPDATSANGPVTGMVRTFWMVTAGTPTAAEQTFLTFMASPSNVNFWHNAGYFSIYDITPITPP